MVNFKAAKQTIRRDDNTRIIGKLAAALIMALLAVIATNKKFTRNRKTINIKGYKRISGKIKKVKGGKKYYVRIRTFKTVSGKKYYSGWFKIKAVKTRR